MTDLRIKQQLSEYLGAPQKAINPKDKEFHEKRAAAFEEWYPKYAAMKQKAEEENLTILEYFEKYHIKQHKKPKKAFVPPDPIEQAIPELVPEDIPLTAEEKAILIAEKEAQLRALQEEEEDEFPCPHCGKIYSKESSLKRHITMKHQEVHE